MNPLLEHKLSDLPKEIQQEALINQEVELGHRDYYKKLSLEERLDYPLTDAFNFEKSSQGHEYWARYAYYEKSEWPA